MATIKRFAVALVAVFLLLFNNAVHAQESNLPDTASWVKVRTTDGNEFIGQVLSQDSNSVVLKTDLFGKLVLHRIIIKSIQPAAKPKIVNGRIWFENPHAPRYIVASSAYNLRKGEGAYENSELFLNQVSYGFTDQFSLGLGFAPIFFDGGPFPIWVNPKFSFPIKKEKAYVALGGLIGYEFDGYNDEVNYNNAFNAAYGQFTYGSRDANISVGIGLNYSHGHWAESPIISLAGTVRLAPWASLVGESYFFEDYDDRVNFTGLGMRFMGRRIALDVCVALFNDGYDLYPIPWGSLHVPFNVGKK